MPHPPGRRSARRAGNGLRTSKSLKSPNPATNHSQPGKGHRTKVKICPATSSITTAPGSVIAKCFSARLAAHTPTSTPLAHVPAQIQTVDAKESRELIARAPYILPLDATETNRLDFQHYALRQALGGNYAAPINHPQSILDVGTGTARWGIELATIFPHSSVIGLDIMVPHLTTYPRNFAFVHGNVLDGLPFANGTFDFVHQR